MGFKHGSINQNMNMNPSWRAAVAQWLTVHSHGVGISSKECSLKLKQKLWKLSKCWYTTLQSCLTLHVQKDDPIFGVVHWVMTFFLPGLKAFQQTQGRYKNQACIVNYSNISAHLIPRFPCWLYLPNSFTTWEIEPCKEQARSEQGCALLIWRLGGYAPAPLLLGQILSLFQWYHNWTCTLTWFHKMGLERT